MKTSTRLLISDLAHTWRQGLAISMLLAAGVGTWVMATSAMRSLNSGRDQYYQQYRFADLFVELTRAPVSLAEKVRQLPGVAEVQSRIVKPVLVQLPGVEPPASCRIISLEEEGAPSLNRLHLTGGRLPQPTANLEVVASDRFAEANHLHPGDTIDAILSGKIQRLKVVGIGISPEVVYTVQAGVLVADDRSYGVLWMNRRAMAAAFNMEGAFNDLVCRLQIGVPARQVAFAIDRLLESYGGRGAYDRSLQGSHSRLADELHQLETMAYVTPAIFLVVACFLFNIVLSRMVHQQREQIATLRAFGFTTAEIAGHYASWALCWVTLGIVAGIGLGIRLSWWMLGHYGEFFRFPRIPYELATREAAAAVGLSVLAAVIGGLSAFAKIVRLQPAVAMRPEPPRSFGQLLIDRLGGSWLISPMSRLILRRMQSNPRRTLLTIIGLALALAVLILGSFMEDTINYVIDAQFSRAQRQDITLAFADSKSSRIAYDLNHVPGVRRLEPFRSVSVRLRHATRERRLAIMGLDPSTELFRILDRQQRPVELSASIGLSVTEKLAELLQVRVGDRVEVEVMEGQHRRDRLPIVAVVPNYTEPAAYMVRTDLHRWLREGEQLSGAFLSLDPRQRSQFFREMKRMPVVASVMDNRAVTANFRRLVSESTWLMRWINATFAAIIAVGIVYNSAVISLAEQGRDLATLRVMGFSRWEVAFVLWGELAILVFLSLPCGLATGCGLAYLTTLALDTESHRFPFVIYPATCAYAVVILLVITLACGWVVHRMLDRLDLIAVLKVKE